MTSSISGGIQKPVESVPAADGDSLSGTIFSIIRFSTHDGPGIRTTVFMKGCPLSCWWCHNPENRRDLPSEIYRPELCIGCGRCIAVCPSGALAAGPHGVSTDHSRCQHCGVCVEACPAEARERTSWWVSVVDLVRSISRDIPFFDQSGGGVTFSGGEPLAQPDFLLAALQRCRELEIHRVVETSGYAAPDLLSAVARVTDLFLYDLKLVDAQKHRAHTGVDNHIILSNLKMLSESNAAIIVRIPLIPGVNDDSESIALAGEFIAGLPRRHAVDLLPFHRAANAKYAKLGLDYRGESLAPPPLERVAEVARQLTSAGLKVRIGG